MFRKLGLLCIATLLLCSVFATAQDNASRFRVMARIDFIEAPTLYGIGEVERHELVVFDLLYLNDWDLTLAMEYPESIQESEEVIDLRAYISGGKIFIESDHFRITLTAFEESTREWIKVRSGISLTGALRYRFTTTRNPDGLVTIGIHRVLKFQTQQKGGIAK